MSGHPPRKILYITEESSQFEYERAILLLNIGERIKRARHKLGLDQKQLAAKMGVPQCWISQIESGCTDFRISPLLKLAVAFKANLHEWLPSRKELQHTAYRYGGYGVKRR